MNSTGQGFESFNVLIAFAMGLAILVIVLGIVFHFENEKCNLSKERFEKALDTALNTPTGETVTEKDICFRGGEQYSALAFGRRRAMDPGCFELQATNGVTISAESSRLIDIKTNFETNVYYQCFLPSTNPFDSCIDDCRACCIVSFGKKPVS